ncbi:MAG: hypothetical protein A2934_00175 [Candidatus Sungbacteria bacterium RIFCSPLOWO2_01_FULL_47_10]|uniref:Uncharacterized protein n=1 Tax=Candidatus Sungbacteria bacterium RIFCSPLOWO2_01_FULL_47_10 TaxID=1802276 RepID=A0A1G2L878_9BACT|nr:MAG: hypothetical protein A2934_00175 [Candidatus Sungbacteria bacterium RIFCSPLOWO2_01_FULL_47_10]
MLRYLFYFGLTVLTASLGLALFSSFRESSVMPPLSHSIEVGFASESPLGRAGGLLIPASCPSYEHKGGECSAPPPEPPATARITADGVDGPITIANNGTAIISWTSAYTSSCTVTKKGGACELTDNATCSGTGHSGAIGNSGPLADIAPPAPPPDYTYQVSCLSNNGTPNPSDTVIVNVAAETACSNGFDDDDDDFIDLEDMGCTNGFDSDEANRYACQAGLCVSVEGVGLNTGSCTYSGTYSGPGVLRLQDERYCSLAECNDGLDNDGDGHVDFPDDIGCASPTDNREETIPGEFEEVPPT